MEKNLHILGFAGSLRKESYNRKLLKIAEGLLPEDTTFETFGLIDIPVFNEDVETEGLPSSVAAFRNAIQKADALLIASPEYNSSITGVLKNAIDWASRSYNKQPNPLIHKPVAILGAGGRGGTDRSQYHLRSVLNHLNMYVVNKPEILINMPGRQVFDEQGNLTDEVAVKLIKQLLQNLVDYTLLLNK
ncbi:MAG: NADPH-dependent FMN reductase [Chloroflexi bacterium HGW-Chloroflexi-3]|nr:MAG: NADPH-dependent FMN reductase [Chloroflexi bacterium HGW-Chloroflexi-3]